MVMLIAEPTSQLPLNLTVDREGSGGVTGLVPTVAVRQTDVADSYLDWNDNTFKTSGWVTKYATLTEAERGTYQRILGLDSVAGISAGSSLVAEYHVDNGSDVVGDAHDVILVVSTNTDTDLLRKALTNKLYETPGSPGVLTLYDDDSATPLLSWDLKDYQGNMTVGVQGSPARREKGVTP
jgi:hypothetical protein